MQIWGIQLGLDIGTFFGLVFGGSIVAGIQRLRRRKAESEEHARRDKEENDRERYRTHKEALEIHESLTSREVFAAIEHARVNPQDPVVKPFLRATWLRGQSRYVSFSSASNLHPELEQLLKNALDQIFKIYPEELKPEQQALKRKQQQRTGDSTKYSWEGSGSHPKIWAINLIAQRWIDENHIVTRREFEESFGAELQKAVPDRASEFNREWLLTNKTDGKYKASDKYLPSLSLSLEGTDYGVHNRCGFRESKVGVEVQIPVIDHFRTVHNYAVAAKS